jgi:hypothetical protein
MADFKIFDSAFTAHCNPFSEIRKIENYAKGKMTFLLVYDKLIAKA